MPAEAKKISLPNAFRKSYQEEFGPTELALLEEALTKPLSSALRTHPQKNFAPNLRPVPWCDRGFFTDIEATFGADPIWHAGGYYVQEPASMILSQYFEQHKIHPARALDLCAAPGGKSTLLRSYLPDSCTLISNEPDATRARILSENFARWGMDETIITSAYPNKIAETGLLFDFILVDAPCSGEGMFRKEPQALTGWSPQNVELCVTRQKEILNAAWEMLERDGVLIYSTCTYNKKENEDQLDYISGLGEIEILPLSLNQKWGVQSHRAGVYRFTPQHTESEGLTIFAIRKKGGVNTSITTKKEKAKKELPSLLNEVFTDKQDALYNHNDSWYYLSPAGQEQLAQLKKIKILAGGVQLGQLKGKDFIPDTNWVHSGSLNDHLPYPRYELDNESAIQYLKRENIKLDEDLDKGIYLVTYKELPLGIVKHLGNRTNNLYPKELSIKNRNLKTEDIPNWD